MLFLSSLLALARGSEPNLRLGHRIGETLRHVSPEEAPAIQAELLSQQKALINPEVSKAFARINARAKEGVPDADICDREWASLCPLGWQRIGSNCLAPRSYRGCKTLMSFEGMDAAQRRSWAKSCQTPWPCKDSCQRDYSQVCPDLWTDIGAGFCEAPVGFESDCLSRYKLDVYSADQKERLSKVCGFQWPCTQSCSKDYAAPCPEGWTEEKQFCLAPGSYAGPCDVGLNATLLDAAAKAAFEVKCAVEYPCASGSVNARATASASQSPVLPSGPIQ